MQDPNRLKNFPITFFAVVMGLAGLTIAWEKIQHTLVIDLNINALLVGVTAVAFAVLAFLYVAKLVRYQDEVIKELRNPIKLNFFPTVSISLLLLAIGSMPLSPVVAHWLWIAGTMLQLVITLYVVNAWIHHEYFEIHHLNPAWFIPAVGNALVPIVGVQLGYPEVSWLFFSIGMVFWLILLTIIFYRVLFHHPIPDKLLPTLFILIAPPAVGFIAYLQLVGELDAFARVLYFSGLFFTLLLFAQLGRFARLEFFLSWWAYSFPVAAITVASLLMYEQTAVATYLYLGGGLLLALTAIVALLLAKTANAVRKRGICLPEQ